MKLKATVYGEGNNDFDAPMAPEVEIEFDDVKEVKERGNFFVVIKNNGDEFATRLHTIKKYALTN